MVSKRFHVTLMALATVLAASTAWCANPFVDAFHAGTNAEDSGNLDEAMKYFSEAVKPSFHIGPCLGKTG